MFNLIFSDLILLMMNFRSYKDILNEIRLFFPFNAEKNREIRIFNPLIELNYTFRRICIFFKLFIYPI